MWARTSESVRQKAWRQVAFFLGVTVALFGYRTLILTSPYNPPRLKAVHFLRKPWMYWFPPFYRYIPAHILWLPGLALLVYALGAFWRHNLRQEKMQRFLQRPGGTPCALFLTVAVVLGYLWMSTASLLDDFWLFFEPKTFRLYMSDLLSMVFLIYVLGLVWKKREQKLGVLAFGLLILIYLPVFTYLGWHYCLAGWFVRASVWWPTVAYLVAQDWKLERVLLLNYLPVHAQHQGNTGEIGPWEVLEQ